MSRVFRGWRISWAIGWIAMSLLAFELVATLATLVVMHFGFASALAAGTCVYAVAFAALPVIRPGV